MEAEFKIVEEAKKPIGMNPKKFALWLFMASVLMIFASLTSVYIVQQSERVWQTVELPSIFWVSSVIILLSSVSMHWAYLAAKRDNIGAVKLALAITLVLGVAFLVAQFMGWGALVDQKVHFVGSNISGSFVYVFTGVHGAHIISGVIFLIIVLVSAFRFKIHSKNMLQIEMCTTYWHFLDLLWLYLFVFLILKR